MDAAALGETVRWARKRAGMTQTDLATAADIPQPTIARIESGAVVPRAATLMTLLAATGHELAIEPMLGARTERDEIQRQLRRTGPQRTWQALGRRAKPAHGWSPTRILRRLRLFGVRFVLIGELAETVHGAPGRIGSVIEVCHATDPENLERLVRALEDLGAKPQADSALLEGGARTLKTDAGQLRLTARPVADDGCEVLWRTASRMLVDVGLQVRVAHLQDLIRIGRARGTARDLEALVVLGAVRDEAAGPVSAP